MENFCKKTICSRIFILLILNLLGSAPAVAQKVFCPGLGGAGSGLFSGTWKTSNSNRTAVIGSGLNGKWSFFQINFSRESTDPIRSEFSLFDGIDELLPFAYDDASIGIEGTNIEITQIDEVQAPLDGQSGCWSAPDISAELRPYRTIFWTAKPRTRTLIMNLRTPRVMVIGLSSYVGNVRISGNEVFSSCTGTAAIFVDGAPLRARDGSNLLFLNGTSIAVVGQKIDVGWNPTCPETNPDQLLRGSLKIELQPVAAAP